MSDKISVRRLVHQAEVHDWNDGGATRALLRLAVAARLEREARAALDDLYGEDGLLRDSTDADQFRRATTAHSAAVAERNAALDQFTDWPEAT